MAAIARFWALYGAQFWRILANKPIYWLYFHANRIGRFYGRIFRLMPGFFPVHPFFLCICVRLLGCGIFQDFPDSCFNTGKSCRIVTYTAS